MTNLSEIQISTAALKHNVRQLRSLVAPGVSIIVVVKGNAYGHGLSEVVHALEDEVDGFQVDDLDELRELRSVTSKRALVLGYVPASQLEEAVGLGGELTLYDLERIAPLVEIGKQLGVRPKVHLKIDTLLGRQGVLPVEVPSMASTLARAGEIEVVAAYTHFANIEDTTDLTHANAQVELFDSAMNELTRHGFSGIGRHLSATSGLMVYESGQGKNSLVRIGIGAYGMYPSGSLARTQERLELQPALRWVSHLAQVKTLPPGHPVGYGLTFVTWRETKIGIVPQGYSDGFDRGLSNVGEVLVGGHRCPIVGRIAMNMFAVDLTHAPDAQVEDEVVLLGLQGKERITAEEIAVRLGTINYEVTTRISALLPRVVVS